MEYGLLSLKIGSVVHLLFTGLTRTVVSFCQSVRSCASSTCFATSGATGAVMEVMAAVTRPKVEEKRARSADHSMWVSSARICNCASKRFWRSGNSRACKVVGAIRPLEHPADGVLQPRALLRLIVFIPKQCQSEVLSALFWCYGVWRA